MRSAPLTDRDPQGDGRFRVATLLAVTTIAAYALVALGTAVSAGGGTTCSTWPSCGTDPTLGPLSGEQFLFWAHRAAALVTGLLVAASGLAVRRATLGRRIRVAVYAAVVAFPVQVGLGAVIVVGGPSLANDVHLVLAMGIFATLLVALVWTLDAAADARRDRASSVDPVELEPAVDADIDQPVEEPSVDASVDPDAEVDTPNDGRSRLRRLAGAYLTLTKPRLMWLLCLVAVAGMGLATLTGATLSATTVLATLAGGVLAIGASGTFNHVYERDRDRKMNRTNDRPLVHELVPVGNALAFAIALVVASMAVLVTWTNVLAAALTLAAIGYYAVLYTVVLKPNTAWNTVLGGGAGALPAVIGWAAVTGDVGWPAIGLAAVIFLWTPAHFYNLAIAFRDDYARGGFPMYPVVEGVAAARRQLTLYLGATLLAASALGWVAGLGWLYTVTSIALGGVFLRSVLRQYRHPTDERTLRSFYVSNYYLGAILVAIVVETLVFA
ncbi:protoheme IX farnesyltransferase [Halovivax ruber XH-70]|uniref:Protoheme IX farnesyltransferase n=1 Tax=Halovivax ruber (strain DSM 18193 / JCM 13892 / XH-70) TaxID=797302 RepID=L0IFC3_HALRX|nr:heme o synthase [Halovivax ruber]AGB17459.1 protoheme IX farnesyltransferase [Halovivax ruber XH-70]